MPTCPKCSQTFHRGAESSCPHCGFRFAQTIQLFGNKKVKCRRVTDSAGVLRHHDRTKLSKELAKIDKRIYPASLAVYFPELTQPFVLRQHSFWFFNQMEIQHADFGERAEPLSPEWLLVLVIDVRTSMAHFVWGYQLDPYINERISGSILKARLLLRDGLFVPAITKIMKSAVRHIASRVNTVAAHPDKYGIISDLPQPPEKGEEKP